MNAAWLFFFFCVSIRQGRFAGIGFFQEWCISSEVVVYTLQLLNKVLFMSLARGLSPVLHHAQTAEHNARMSCQS
jgi:hypothetical protein